MKPYGQEKKYKNNAKRDVHPKRGYINWWEDVCDFLSRSRMKQIWKKEIEKDINR